MSEEDPIKSFVLRPVRLLLRPLWEGVAAMIDARGVLIENRIAQLDERLTRLEAGWRQHVPALLDAVSTVKALGYELTNAEENRPKEPAEHQQNAADDRRPNR